MKKAFVSVLAAISMALTVVCANADDAGYTSTLYGALNHYNQQITNGTFMLVADLDGNGVPGGAGWNYLSPALPLDAPADTFLWDTADYIIGRGALTKAEQDMNFKMYSAPSGYDPGVDNYYMLWFDTPFVDSVQAVPGSGTWYGAAYGGKVVSLQGGTATDDVDGGMANFRTTVVPEPASIFLGLLGGATLLARRRLNIKKA